MKRNEDGTYTYSLGSLEPCACDTTNGMKKQNYPVSYTFDENVTVKAMMDAIRDAAKTAGGATE